MAAARQQRDADRGVHGLAVDGEGFDAGRVVADHRRPGQGPSVAQLQRAAVPVVKEAVAATPHRPSCLIGVAVGPLGGGVMEQSAAAGREVVDVTVGSVEVGGLRYEGVAPVVPTVGGPIMGGGVPTDPWNGIGG